MKNLGNYSSEKDLIKIGSDTKGAFGLRRAYSPDELVGTTFHEYGHAFETRVPQLYHKTSLLSNGEYVFNENNFTVSDLYGNKLKGKFKGDWEALPTEAFAEYFKHRNMGLSVDKAGELVAKRMLKPSELIHADEFKPLFLEYERHLQMYMPKFMK